MRVVASVACLCLAMLAGLLFPGGAAGETQRSVLVLDQSSVGLPFNTAVATAIRLTLNATSKSPISFYAENLDANRFFGAEYENDFVNFLKSKYRERPINVVIVVGVSALDFITRRREQIWPSVPVVFTAIDEATVAGLKLPANVTGATMQLTLQDMVKAARIVVPGLKSVAIVGDPLERQTFYRHFKEEIPAVAAHLEIIDLMNLRMEALKDRLASLPDQTAVLYTGIYYTDDGVSYVPAELTVRIAEWSNRPVVINVASYLNKGAIGGYIVHAEPIGQQAAHLALRILGGESASGIPIVKVPSPLVFEWPALKRWHVSESGLPPGSEVRFRIPGAWEQYRWQILAICAALLLQSALIGWLIYEHRRRQQAEVQSRQSMAELTFMNRRAAAGELSASIAHEVNQPLTAIATRAGTALRWLRAETPDLEKVRGTLEQILAASHRAADIVTSIRAMFRKDTSERAPIDINRLILTVISIVRVDLQKNGVELETRLAEKVPIVQGDRVQLQQVVLNLLMNAVEAMQSVPNRVLKVQTDHKPEFVQVSIEDTGPGIDPSNVDRIFKPLFTTKPTGTGMGLAICHSIIESHNGRIWATPGTNGGSIFHFEMPTGTANSQSASAG